MPKIYNIIKICNSRHVSTAFNNNIYILGIIVPKLYYAKFVFLIKKPLSYEEIKYVEEPEKYYWICCDDTKNQNNEPKLIKKIIQHKVSIYLQILNM